VPSNEPVHPFIYNHGVQIITMHAISWSSFWKWSTNFNSYVLGGQVRGGERVLRTTMFSRRSRGHLGHNFLRDHCDVVFNPTFIFGRSKLSLIVQSQCLVGRFLHSLKVLLIFFSLASHCSLSLSLSRSINLDIVNKVKPVCFTLCKIVHYGFGLN